MSVSTASRPDSPKYSRAGAGVLTLRRPATNAPTIKTAATTQIVAMMLPEAVVVIVAPTRHRTPAAPGARLLLSGRRRQDASDRTLGHVPDAVGLREASAVSFNFRPTEKAPSKAPSKPAERNSSPNG